MPNVYNENGYEQFQKNEKEKSDSEIESFNEVEYEYKSEFYSKSESNSYMEKKPEVQETIEWISSEDEPFLFTLDEMKTWVREGPPIKQIENETEFCDAEMLKKIVTAKEIFDHCSLQGLLRARYRANAFETIGSVFFMNRAALKMANIDAATNFMFTNIDESLVHRRNNAPYYFADVCAGPGGFTEYLLWRKQWHFKGFGFTLKDDNDFKVKQSKHISSSTFNALYGHYGDGNIFKIENIQDFAKCVKHETENLGVHFMMADGGFSVQGEENLQEVLSKELYICQCLMALEIVRTNGYFVTKLFDLFTPFSVGLIYFMYKCFKKIAILKPNTSRPANAERYLICSQLRSAEHVEVIKAHLTDIASRIWEIRGVHNNNMIDVNEIILKNMLKEDEKFYNFITESNNKIGNNQISGLKSMEHYFRNERLRYPNQEELRRRCLEYWKIPVFLQPPSEFPFEDFLQYNIYQGGEFMNNSEHTVKTLDDLKKCLTNIEDWSYTFTGCKENTNNCSFYAAVNESNVYRLRSKNWVKVRKLQLTTGTLLYGEMVKEKVTKLTDNVQSKIKQSLHVIDAIRLGDEYIADKPYTARLNLVNVYCQAVNHESRTNNVRVRAKNAAKLSQFSVWTLDQSNGCRLPTLGYNTKKETYEVNSVLILNSKHESFFNDTFTSRIQVFIHKNEECKNEEGISFSMLQQLIEHMKSIEDI